MEIKSYMEKSLSPVKEIKFVDEIGEFEGYASVFNTVDRGSDVILPGAFKSSLQQRGAVDIKLLWQHDPKEPIGTITELIEDEHGLYIKGRLLSKDVQRASEARALLHANALDGLSIGFHTIKSDTDSKGIRTLKAVDLWEVSFVTFPMNEQARITAFKSYNNKILEFKKISEVESFLHSLSDSEGQRISKSTATLLVSQIKNLSGRSDSEDGEEEKLIANISRLNQLMKG